MIDNRYQIEAGRLKIAAPLYLAIQGAILVLTYLDTPVYMEAYQAKGILTVTGWAGAWFALAVFGLSLGVWLLAGKPWRAIWQDPERVRLSLAYLLGSLAGMLSLGLRFTPVMPPTYFVLVAGLAVFGLLIYSVWLAWRKRNDEIFA